MWVFKDLNSFISYLSIENKTFTFLDKLVGTLYKNLKILTLGYLKEKRTTFRTCDLYLDDFFSSFSFCGNLLFMPQFIDKFSEIRTYAIIFIGGLLGVSGSFARGKAVQTNLGRKYTTILGFSLSRICNLLAYFVEDGIYVIK